MGWSDTATFGLAAAAAVALVLLVSQCAADTQHSSDQRAVAEAQIAANKERAIQQDIIHAVQGERK